MLTKLVHGGDQPGAVTIAFEIADFGWHAAYRVARQFRTLTRPKQEQLVSEFAERVEPIEATLDDLDNEASEAANDALADSAGMILNALRNALDDAHNFLKRKISWRDFCFSVEDADEELKFETENQGSPDSPFQDYLVGAAHELGRLLRAVDSGNRQEAEAYATKVAQENKNLVEQHSAAAP